MSHFDKTRLSNLTKFGISALNEMKSDLASEYNSLRVTALTADTSSELTDLLEAVEAVKAELATREETTADTNEVTVELEIAEEVPQTDATDAVNTEPTQEQESVTADATIVTPEGVSAPDANQASAIEWNGAVLTASADIPGMVSGTKITDESKLADAVMARRNTLRSTASTGDGEKAIVASLAYDLGEARTLGSDAMVNKLKIDAVTSAESLVASGGVCAPVEPYYPINVLGDACRPVRDTAMTRFSADRGRITHVPPPVLADAAGAIQITTIADDAAGYVSNGGPTPNKPCIPVTCPAEVTCEVYGVSKCLTFGNFGAKTYPEQVTSWIKLASAQHARQSEVELLDAIQAGSTAVTAAAVYGATSSILGQIDVAVAAYKSRHRLCGTPALRVIFPEWIKATIRVDLARAKNQRDFTVTDAEVDSYFRARGVTVSYHVDSSTTGGQIFGAQAAGPLLTWPPTVEWFLYAEGSWLFLDGATLDLGLVRDSTLNSTNDYQMFMETFEGTCFTGVESLAITSDICADGTFAPDGTPIVCPVA